MLVLLIANPNPHCDLQDPLRSSFCRLWISLLPPSFSHTWIFLFHPIPQACSCRGPPPHWALCLEFFLERIVGLVPSLCVGLNWHITYTEGFWALQGRQDHGSQLFVPCKRMKHPHSCRRLSSASHCRQRTFLHWYWSYDLLWSWNVGESDCGPGLSWGPQINYMFPLTHFLC